MVFVARLRCKNHVAMQFQQKLFGDIHVRFDAIGNQFKPGVVFDRPNGSIRSEILAAQVNECSISRLF